MKRQIDGFVSMYYKGIMMVHRKPFSLALYEHLSLLSLAYDFICTFCLGQCDDESCKHTTRSPNFRLLGDRERGTVCPNYPNCNGTLLRKVYALIHLVRSLIFLLLHRTAFNSKPCLITVHWSRLVQAAVILLPHIRHPVQSRKGFYFTILSSFKVLSQSICVV